MVTSRTWMYSLTRSAKAGEVKRMTTRRNAALDLITSQPWGALRMTGTMSIRIKRPMKTRKKRVCRRWADLYFDSQTSSQKVSASSMVLPQTMQCL